jgi:hypothetical protein
MDIERVSGVQSAATGGRTSPETRFNVTRKDVDFILTELADQPQAVLYAPLLEALLAAAAALDTRASRLDTGHSQTTDLPLPEEHASRFDRWLQDAALRARVAGDAAKAQTIARIRGSER